MGLGIPDYKNLDLSGEAGQTARNMEDRAREPASQELFNQLVVPLLHQNTDTVLEIGCGTAALSARIANANPDTYVLATDKSQIMIESAQMLRASQMLRNLAFRQWDVTGEELGEADFDLIISSVVVPYLTPEEIVAAIARLAGMLTPVGILAFLEQDIFSLKITTGHPDFTAKYLKKIGLLIDNPHVGEGLVPLMEKQGLKPLPRKTFTWTDATYGPYVHRLLARTAKDMVSSGESSEEEAKAWLDSIEALAAEGKFLYSLDYKLIAAMA
jgi:SAM-dependent methyltransferase